MKGEQGNPEFRPRDRLLPGESAIKDQLTFGRLAIPSGEAGYPSVAVRASSVQDRARSMIRW